MLQKNNTEHSNTPAAKSGGKFSYGWVVAIAGAYIIMVSGNFQYTFGVLVKPLIDRFGWLRAAISGGVAARSIAGGITSPIGGALGDRYGHKKFILIGIILVGLSFLLTARISSLWELYTYFGILSGIGITLVFVPIVSITTQWFGTKSGLANGIMLSGFGWAQIVIPPLVTYLILEYNWETCLTVLGIAVLVTGAIAWRFVKTPPRTAFEAEADSNKKNPAANRDDLSGGEVNFTLAEACRTITLWQLCAILLIASAAFQLVVIHIVVAAIDTGITAESAAIILTVSGVTNTAGRLILGYLATRIGNKVILAFCLAVQAVVLYFLADASQLNVFFVLSAVYGFVYGGVFPLIPTLTGSLFGTKSMGVIFGIVNGFYPLGGAIGPLLGGYIFDTTGSYYAAFIIAAIATTAVFFLSLLLKRPRKRAAISNTPV